MPRGYGFKGAGMYGGNGYGFANGYGGGPRGNWGTNCRMFPSLPRRWWATGAYQVQQNAVYQPYLAEAASENEVLKAQAQFLRKQLGEIEKRLEQMGNKDTGAQGAK